MPPHRQTEKSATDDALADTWSPSKSRTHGVNGPITTALSPIWTPAPAMSPNRVAGCAGTLVPAKAGIENETSNVLKTNGYNLEHNFGHGKGTLASLGSIPPPCSQSWPGVRQSSHGAQHTGPSSTCERSPPSSLTRTGIICSAPSPPPRHDHPDETPNGHALTFTTIVRANLTHRSIWNCWLPRIRGTKPGGLTLLCPALMFRGEIKLTA